MQFSKIIVSAVCVATAAAASNSSSNAAVPQGGLQNVVNAGAVGAAAAGALAFLI